MAAKRKKKTTKKVRTLQHGDAKRRNIPTAEYESLVRDQDQKPIPMKYPRNTDLDPQLVWRGKDEQDWSDLVVEAPPLYIQEKVHPKALIDDLLRRTRESRQTAQSAPPEQLDLFADFNGVPEHVDRTEFYQHEQSWSNRMILGDSLQVMASLAEREGLRGKVQCVYFDPPYGIKFNSNFQWSTTSRDVTDGKGEHITREPEQVKAFRDTWSDGIHSYLTYLRDRLLCVRDLLAPTGSVFVQIGDENVHRVRSLLDEVFGESNFVSQITIQKAGSIAAHYLGGVADFVLWYARDREQVKYRELYADRQVSADELGRFKLAQLDVGKRIPVSDLGRPPKPSELVAPDPLQSASVGREKGEGAASWFSVEFEGRTFRPTSQSRWKTNEIGMGRLIKADRIVAQKTSIRYARRLSDFPVSVLSNIWGDLSGASQKIYVVQTSQKIVERCILLSSDPGDLVLDPTCGSGTTASVAEQWGRRWITIDTSRVALALARARIMGSRYPFYLLADSKEGRAKLDATDEDVSGAHSARGDIRMGFVYKQVPHIMLKSIVTNSRIDVIWETYAARIAEFLARLNLEAGTELREWEVPLEAKKEWSTKANRAHDELWSARRERQRQIDAAISAASDRENLYDKPFVDETVVRVAGPFTVESLSPHRVLALDADDELLEVGGDSSPDYIAKQDFPRLILDNLRAAGVQQAHKEDKIDFTSVSPWPGERVCGEGRYREGEVERRAGVFIGPEFGTVQRSDLVAAAREAADAGFDVLISCAFSYEGRTADLRSLGKIPVLQARMNADLHMADTLKNTGKGNLFVIFGEPDIDILIEDDGRLQVRVNGVDVFKPQTGEVVSDGADGIACWFIDTNYNEESFFVRHAYFLGASDPYKALSTTLKAEIDADAWETLHSDTSRPFSKPSSGRIAVKVINHLGDEVMKVFKV